MNVRQRILGNGSATVVQRRRRTDRAATDDTPSSLVLPPPEGENFISNLLRSCPPRYRMYRAGDYLHVSDLIGKCTRKISIVERHGLSMPSERSSDSQEITFAQGSCIGDFVVDRVISGHAAKVYARWACLCGAYVSDPMTKDRVDSTCCTHCGTPRTKHVEISIRDENLMVVGNVDLALLLDTGALYFTELKSIAPDAWKELSRPLPLHIVQAVMYWELARRQGLKLVDQLSILYVSKGMVFKGSCYKEYHIRPQEHLHRLTDLLADAQARKIALAGGAFPRRVLCSAQDDTEAKKCPVASICFSEG